MTAIGTLLAAAGLIIATVAWLKPRPAAPEESRTAPSASSSVSRSGLFRTPWLGLEFYRDDRRLPIVPQPQPLGYDRSRDIVEVEVGEAPFEIRMPALPPDEGMRICAWVDDSIFAKVLQDKTVTIDSPFMTGKGMADTAAGSGALYLDNDAFNYFKGTRLAHIGEHQDAAYISSFEVPERVRPDLTADFGPHTSVYLVVYINRDGDDMTDSGEYEFVVLRR